MEVISKIVEKMIEPIIERLYTSMGRRFGYLVHYKKNIKDFADEVDKLRATKAIVEIKVGAARDNAEVIYDSVSKWQRDVQSMEDDKSRLLQAKDNLKCLDVCSRYRLGKEGKKKKPDVTKLIADGNNFGDVGYQRPLTVTFQKTYSINYESFPSRESVFEEIMKALKDDGTYKIGIHGMPGVGKTRMMEEVAQQAQKESLFDEVAEIVVSQNPILTDIQQKLAKSLNMKEPEKASKAPICDRLRNGKKILVIVDDVWNNEIKLEDIGIPAADNHTKGCKIILTSRIKEVCLRMGVQKEFKIGVLSEHEALKLFKKTVGDFTECPELHSIAEEVCRECDCLPLAIVTIGAALQYEKEVDGWNNALEQLKHSKAYNIPGVSDKLYSGIQLSYKYLKLKDQQLCFLHCCLFPEDAEISIDDLAIYGVGTRFLEDTDRESMEKARQRTRTLIGTLKRSNLLLNGQDQNFVKMHDVIRDVAISIALEEKDAMFLVKAGVRKWIDEDEYKQCKAISLRFNDDCVLLDDSECTEVCTLMLEFRNHSSKVPSSFFKVMEKLRVLQLRNVQISELPSSLKNLRMLRLYNCKLVNVAFLKEFKKLEILCIRDSDLKELALEIGQLTSLRLLDVRYCYKLKIIPSGVISSLSQLEELYIPDEFDQWVVKDNASLNELNSLKHLISLQVFVPDVVLLPPLIEPLFKSLIRFQISIGSCFDYWHSATRILKLDGFPMKKELNILMEKAEVLLLENLPNGLCGSGSFSNLSSLKVVNCNLMIYLFSSATARNLLQLQKLTISGCKIMEEIVRDDEEAMDAAIIFHYLKKIKLKDLPKLRSFYVNMKKSTTRGECNTSTLVQALFNHKVKFPCLEELFMKNLDNLEGIWHSTISTDSVSKLRKLELEWCRKLLNVGSIELHTSFQNLEEVKVLQCESLQEVFKVEGPKGAEETVVFPQLRTMRLEDLPKLSSFCCSTIGGEELVVEESNIPQQQALFNNKVSLPAVEELTIEKLQSLTAIWVDQSQKLEQVKEAEDSFRHLTYMIVRGCEKLVNVIPSDMLPRLQNLKELEVEGCDSLFSEVEVLGTVEKGSPTAEPTINVLPRLQEMNLSKLPNLVTYMRLNRKEQFAGGICAYSNLTYLHLSNRDNLENVFSPSTARYLVHLQKLEVYHCEKMEEIVAIERGELGEVGEEELVHDEIIVFPQLKHLKLEYLPNLKSFCCCTRGSKKGEEETVELNIPRVEALFNHKVAFLALEKLSITNLESLEAIWNDQSQSLLLNEAKDFFQFLKCIEVNGCNKVVNVIPANVLPRLQNLTQLHMSKRHNLINVFSSSMAKYLVHLQELEVTDCEKMEAIVAVERGLLREDGEEDLGHDEIIVFHQLKHLTLQQLPNLNSFCSICGSEKEEETAEQNFGRVETLFNYKVRFPALEELEIGKLQSLTVIWDKQLFLGSEAQDSFRQLRFVTIQGCDKLVNVIPTYAFPMLHNLESLKVVSCESMVYGAEVAAIEESSDEILMFPQLKKLKLKKLPNLKSFCYSNIGGSKEEEEEGGGGKTLVFPQLNTIGLRKLPKLSGICCSRRGGEESVLNESNIPQQQVDLFNYKVEFPILEKLVLGDGSNIFGGIWKNCNKVRLMGVKKYINVVNACTLLQWLSLEVVEELRLESCDSLEVIFNLEGFGAIERKAIVSSQAKTLTLIDLPKLERIWIMESQGLLVFHNLTELRVVKCNSLRYVFSLSIARGLTQLRTLWIEKCSVMEEIVRREGQGEEDDMEEIVFSQLEELWLWELPNLTCFCGTNNAFNFPSLKEVYLWECPKLQTFTSGGISTSGGITMYCDKHYQGDVSDLNSHVQRRLVGKGKVVHLCIMLPLAIAPV